eukprot:TRINITY_DN9933_c0_g1_i1.p1 TRINITY_DN9933_c0_g1~~TRINITY_DN9933_c0_g1_i1.p1  ORF type:complete len:786 (-),score=225.69 TRINITY_DN9933_c0_g1_i1:290-2647(-)
MTAESVDLLDGKPPPPAEPDLEEVYRPFEDASLQDQVTKPAAEPAPQPSTANAEPMDEEVAAALGLIDTKKVKKEVDLLDIAAPAPAAAAASTAAPAASSADLLGDILSGSGGAPASAPSSAPAVSVPVAAAAPAQVVAAPVPAAPVAASAASSVPQVVAPLGAASSRQGEHAVIAAAPSKTDAAADADLLAMMAALNEAPAASSDKKSSAQGGLDIFSEPAKAVDMSNQKGLLDELPPGVSVEEVTKGKLKLTGEAAEDVAGDSLTTDGAAKPEKRSIPTDAKGFGSEDLFGPEPGQEQSVTAVLEEAKQQLIKGAAVAAGVAGLQPGALGGLVPAAQEEPPAPEPQASALDQEHMGKTVNRACEGKWVPTYMRYQMAEHGHTDLPSRPNAHEYSANSAPPTVGETFEGMGEDFAESAQQVFNFVLAIWSSLALQCQKCSEVSATDIHERIIDFGENICKDGSADGDDLVEGAEISLRPLREENATNYGPLRSRQQKTIEGIGVDRLLEICRSQIVPVGTSVDQQLLKSRNALRQRCNSDRSVEDLLYATEVSAEVMPAEALQHIFPMQGPSTAASSSSAGPGLGSSSAGHTTGRNRVFLLERWHKEPGRLQLEIINDPSSNGPILLTARIDVVSTADKDTCQVDSRLYCQMQEHGAVLPRGLVEQLNHTHHLWLDRLRTTIRSAAPETAAYDMRPSSAAASASTASAAPSSAMAQPGNANAVGPYSSGNRPLPMAAGAAAGKNVSRNSNAGTADPAAIKAAVAAKSGKGAMDSSFLMQVADGI